MSSLASRGRAARCATTSRRRRASGDRRARRRVSVRCRPGNTRGSSGADGERVDLAAPGADEQADAGRVGALLAVATACCAASAVVPPSGRATSVVEPPPSRLRPVSAPRSSSICAVCASVVPSAALVWRPSVISRNIVLPPSLKPIAVRGATDVSPCGRHAVLDQRLVGADRPLHLARHLVLEAVGQRDRVAGLERLDRVGAGVAADEVERAVRDRARCRRRVDLDDLAVLDQDLGDVRRRPRRCGRGSASPTRTCRR